MLWEKEKLLVTSNFSFFPKRVFKRLAVQTWKKRVYLEMVKHSKIERNLFIYVWNFYLNAKRHSSVSSVANLRTGGHWLIPGLANILSED